MEASAKITQDHFLDDLHKLEELARLQEPSRSWTTQTLEQCLALIAALHEHQLHFQTLNGTTMTALYTVSELLGHKNGTLFRATLEQIGLGNGPKEL